mgnify:CR=1 FL=1
MARRDSGASSDDGPLTARITNEAFLCPIGCSTMRDPVFLADGHSYDRTALQQWFERGRTTSPLHGGALANQSFVTNQALKSQVAEWLQRRGADHAEAGEQLARGHDGLGARILCALRVALAQHGPHGGLAG